MTSGQHFHDGLPADASAFPAATRCNPIGNCSGGYLVLPPVPALAIGTRSVVLFTPDGFL
ncbi:MAG: hypothetical protein FD153_310 [Rhodospirillaceae bacterium]|nr:MAG: hypothetical protein FD153_310 [Rhodospirillaceae bacterium]